MRLILRCAGVAALALAAVTCSEFSGSPTGTRSTVQLAIAPSFSASAARAYASLASAGTQITNVHIVLLDQSGAVALDTVVNFPTNLDSISINLPVQISGPSEPFQATVELRDATNTVQFSSTGTVTAHQLTGGSSNSSGGTIVTLQYVGPGHAAKTVTVSPGDANLSPGGTESLIATATDSAGRTVADVTVTWTTSDGTIATIASTGSATATLTSTGARGKVTVTATVATGVAGTASATVVPQPSKLVVVAPAPAVGPAFGFMATPFVVELDGTDGLPIANRLITFVADTTGGTYGEVQTAYVTTNAAGRASATIRPGRTIGTYKFHATAGTVVSPQITVTATNPVLTAVAELIPITPLSQSYKDLTAVTANQFVAQLADSNGYYLTRADLQAKGQADVTITIDIYAGPIGSTATSRKAGTEHYQLTATSDASGQLRIPPLPTSFRTSGVFDITVTSNASATMLNACVSPAPACLVTGTFTIQP